MKRNFFTLTLIILLVFLLGGCSLIYFKRYPSQSYTETAPITTPQEDDSAKPFDLERLAYVDGITYYRDTVSDVMYLRSGGNHGGGLIVMPDPETGLPLTYARYMELYNQLSKDSE